MLIWIRVLLSTAAEIKTLEGREMLAGLISPPVTDWLLHNTSSLARLDVITIVGQEYDLLGSVQFWSAWFEFTIGCLLAPSLGILSLNYTTLVFVSLISCIFLHKSWSISHMENKQWQKLAEKKSRHNQKSHGMYWNIIVYPFNCLSWSILTQRDENYEYSVIDSRWCVRVFFFVYDIYMPFYFYIYGI